jgi:hypothetical protein
MVKSNTYRTLVWIIVILLATNLSMGISFLYHKQQDHKQEEQVEEAVVEIPAQQRTRFFRDELGLNYDQVEKFRELNREFNRTAWNISHNLERLRTEMVLEMGKNEPNQKKLEAITAEIGERHTELKKVTIDYYLKMKAECNDEQKEKLNETFMSMLKKNEDVKLPGGYGRNRRNQNNNN